MKTLIEGGWVVAFNGASHEVHEGGSVVFEGDRVVHAGGPYAGPVDVRLSGRGHLVSPGFINTHVHTAGGGGDYLLTDMARDQYRTANYMSFAAPLKGKLASPPADAVAALRAYTFLHALRNGSTTIIDVGGLRGDWEGYARLVDELGVRVYASPPFRDRNTFSDAAGRLCYEDDGAAGREGLKVAVEFVRSYDGTAGGRLRGLLNAAQVETCSEPLLRAAKGAARELDVPIHTHAGGNLIEFHRVMEEHGRTPVQFLADIGFLDERTLIGHGVFTTAHPWSHYPFGDDLRALAGTGATVGHCPYKYAKMAIALHSFQRYLDAGVNVAMGTDTYPMDMVAELRWASMLCKIADANYRAGQPRDVYNAATLASCKFLGRQDLGRLSPGAKADLLLIRLDQLGAACYRDPIKALVDSACGRDIDTVIVDGVILVQGGRFTRVDEEAVYARARQATHHYWQQTSTWRPDGCGIDAIIPPAFPLVRTP
jgi:cytosine/adenosine deaminase-related metal-dependent hydrolase